MSESGIRRSETELEETFKRDGFVAVPGLFGEEEMRRISALRSRNVRIADPPERAPKWDMETVV